MNIKQINRDVFSKLVCLMVAALMISPALAAPPFSTELELGGQKMVLNGEGPRKKLFITIYDTGLYLAEKSSDAVQIIQADKPMAVMLKMVSSLATAEKMAEAMREGFEKSTGGNTAPIQAEIDAMIDGILEKGVKPDDEFINAYQPGVGVMIYKNGEKQTEIKGLPFKQALFGIWLSKNPIQSKLKKQLLGR